jgi:hypothetical protein
MVNITTLIETNPIMATPNRQPKYNESRRGDPRGRPKIKTIPQTVDQNNIDKGQPQGIAPTENPSQGIAPTENP